jgi:type IV fimbrial biogenesis protein FimT
VANFQPMRKHRGFTLIEMLVVLTIVGVLAMLTAPSFNRLILANSMTSAVNSFMADLRFARSEAIRLGGKVIMCRSNSPEAASPTCGSGSGTDGNGWVSGWIVFHDMDGSGTRNTGDLVLRVQGPINSVNSISDAGTSTSFNFTATGRLASLSGAPSFQFGSNPPFTNDLQRVVCINIGGRARIAGDGTSACSGDN